MIALIDEHKVLRRFDLVEVLINKKSLTIHVSGTAVTASTTYVACLQVTSD